MLDGDEFYLAAFWELSSTRSQGWGEGQIPWTAMKDYAEFHELEDDVARAFVQVMRAMDSAYLEWQADESRRKRKEEELNGSRDG